MANYDVLESKESYLGTEIRTRVPDEAYKSGWDAIWSNKQTEMISGLDKGEENGSENTQNTPG